MAEERTEDAKLRRSKSSSAPFAEKKSMTGGLQLEPGFVPASKLADQRLLEYRLYLTYRTSDFTRARSELLTIVGRRGFLGQTDSSLRDRATMRAQFAVRSAELTEVLKELEALGSLQNERVQVTDHTESYLLQQIRSNREQLRTRRKASVSRGGLTARNWVQRNAALERSEDALDKARHEKWKLRDRSRWARVHVELLGPETAPAIAVPAYERALVGLLNLTLALSYALLWLSPLLLLAFLVWLLRRRLITLLRRVRGTETPA